MIKVELEYYSLLDKFKKTCIDLVKMGHPLLVVVICHELYRFLYPTDSYAKFINTDPVNFSINHIKRLIELAENYSNLIIPYQVTLNSQQWSNQKETELVTSDLYSIFWNEFDGKTLSHESIILLQNRIPNTIVESDIRGKEILDMGCGSGRYSIALAQCGAKNVTSVDLQEKSFHKSRKYCEDNHLNVKFIEGNVHNLPFDEGSFDFVFCNGVLHHTTSVEKGLKELHRVLRPNGTGYLYLYGTGGFFWNTRDIMREIFHHIPLNYARSVLSTMGMPTNRFIFCDTWYVPIEQHLSMLELHNLLISVGLGFEKMISNQQFDLDKTIVDNIKMAEIMWGEGEHRYYIHKR